MTASPPARLRLGMVGGGRGAFIGAVHRIAAAMDQQIELVCGAFSSDPDRSRASGGDLFLPPVAEPQMQVREEFNGVRSQELAIAERKRAGKSHPRKGVHSV